MNEWMSSAWSFIKKETPAQIFSCKSCEILRSICFVEHLYERLLRTQENTGQKKSSCLFVCIFYTQLLLTWRDKSCFVCHLVGVLFFYLISNVLIVKSQKSSIFKLRTHVFLMKISCINDISTKYFWGFSLVYFGQSFNDFICFG